MHYVYESSLQARTIKTASFDTKTKKCVMCTPHSHKALKARGGGRWCCLALTNDHCFPSCLPAGDRDERIRVVRVEDGSLQEVTHALANAIGNTIIHVGTVFILGSVSHLSKTGTQRYITDWVRSRWWLRSRYGEKCMVLPLVPVSMQGVSSKSTVRCLIETLHWFMSLKDTEAVLMRNITEQFCATSLLPRHH